jgi:hypothetical protein
MVRSKKAISLQRLSYNCCEIKNIRSTAMHSNTKNLSVKLLLQAFLGQAHNMILKNENNIFYKGPVLTRIPVRQDQETLVNYSTIKMNL